MRKALTGAAAALFVWGAIVAVTGGLDARILGVDIRSRDPIRPLVVGVLLVLVQAVFHRHALTRDLERAVAFVRSAAAAIALVLAVALAAHGIVFGTFSVGGSDAYGYVNQAYDWYDGVMPQPIALSARLPFDVSERLQAPLGYREGPRPHTIVPTYAPGLPLLMTVALAIAGACGPFLVTPLAAALFVWFTFVLGRRAGGALAGLAAAFIAAISPVVLYQTLWPMSDIPAAAVWTGAAVAVLRGTPRDAAMAGVLTALGVLIRPNLLPVAVVLAVPLVWHGPIRARLMRLFGFALPVTGAVVFAGWLNAIWFGSPFNSGYGSAREIYSWANVLPNLVLNGRWIRDTQTPLMLLALLPIVPRLRRDLDVRAIALCAALFLATLACYVGYGQFEVWWYLRFLLPGFGGLAALVAAGLIAAVRLAPKPFGLLGGAIVIAILAAQCLAFVSRQRVFGGIRDSQSRYETFGKFAATSLPDNAALLAVQHSGSLRFHTGRPLIRFDIFEYPRSEELIPALEHAGHHPFLVVDDDEMADVRTRFGIPADAPLPWPIRARMRELGGVTVYDMATTPLTDGPVALEPPARQSWCDAQARAAPHK